MATQADFLREVRAAVDQIFAHRKVLRRVAVRFQFWPEGLVIATRIALREEDCDNPHKHELREAARQEIVPWDKLETIDAAELAAIVDRVCQPAHDMLAKGAL